MLKIYLDTCCYNRPYDDQSVIRNALEAQAKLHIQSLIKEGRFLLVSSFVLLYENSNIPYIMTRASIEDFLRNNSKIYIGVESFAEIQPLIEQIMASGLKIKDATHIARALYAECDYFLSTDDRLLKYKSDSMALVNPLDFIRLEAE